MKQVPFRIFIPPPLVLRDGCEPPEAIVTVRLADLCRLAEIPMRITGGPTVAAQIVVHSDDDVHLRGRPVLGAPVYYVGFRRWKDDRLSAIRVLEVLAQSFHDYGARECLRPMKLFCVPKVMGRPPVLGRAMTARERMAMHRRRKKAA
jgi:hypothetical protein